MLPPVFKSRPKSFFCVVHTCNLRFRFLLARQAMGGGTMLPYKYMPKWAVAWYHVATTTTPRGSPSVYLSDVSSTPSDQRNPCTHACLWHMYTTLLNFQTVCALRVLERDNLVRLPCVAICCKATLSCASLLASDAVGAVPA